MQVGKIPGDRLKEIVLSKIGKRRQEVLVSANIGEDSAVVDLDGDLLVVSSDPITGACKNTGYLAVNVACNDLIAAGAEPVGIQVVLLLPPTTTDQEIAFLMEEIDKTAQTINVDIIGGHTEVLSIVTKPIITITAIGRVKRDRYITSAGACTGDDIIITKGVGIEGTYILAEDYQEELLDKGVSEEILASAREFKKQLSVIKEGKIAADFGVHAMHDVTEGGLYGALVELSQATNKGFQLYYDLLPVSAETRIICQALDLDPAGLISSGSMLIITSDGENLVNEFAKSGLKSALIGKIVDSGYYTIGKDGIRKEFHWSEKDELWRFMA